MRSPLRALREFRREFSRVMEEHEDFLRAELAPGPERVARAREFRNPQTDRHTPGATPAEGALNANQ